MAYKEVRKFNGDGTRHFQGLSTDTEPTETAYGKIPEGSTLWILDTKAGKTYHEATATWYAVA